MKINIEIECEDEREILMHLSEIRKQIKKEIKAQGGEITAPFTCDDKNCYGVHLVNVIPECSTGNHFPDGNGFCLYCNGQLSTGVPLNIGIV